MFKDLIDNFIVFLRITNKSEETIKGYKKELTYFMNFAQDTLNCRIYIEDVTIELLENYVLYMKDVKGCQPASINRAVHAMRSFYNYLVKRDLYHKNVAALLEPAKLQQKERCFLKETEFKKLCDKIDNPLVNIVVQTLYYTGLRITECLTLTLKDVDMKNKLIHVVAGKGNKDRTIPISNKLHSILSGYLQNVRAEGESDRFFSSRKSGKISREYINRIIKKAALDSGINKDVTCHILRHSFATNLVSKNVNLVHIQRLLGHSSLNVTSIYTHTTVKELEKSVNML